MRTREILGLLSLAVLAGSATAQQCYVAGVHPIPDNGTFSTPLGCISCGVIESVTLGLRIQHGRQGDLVVRLRHDQSGVVATLLNRPGTEDGQSAIGYTAVNLGGSTSNLFIFDDSAAGPYAVPPVGAFPLPGIANVSGRFRPTHDPMSVFTGLNAGVTWTLLISDAATGMTGSVERIDLKVQVQGPCYADCDGSGGPNINDYSCFLGAFAGGNSYANCDQSTVPPILNVADFLCFLNAFADCCAG